MQLVIVAATGATGRHLLDQALAAGHGVTAVVCSPEKLPPGVAAVRCDMAAPEAAAMLDAAAGPGGDGRVLGVAY